MFETGPFVLMPIQWVFLLNSERKACLSPSIWSVRLAGVVDRLYRLKVKLEPDGAQKICPLWVCDGTDGKCVNLVSVIGVSGNVCFCVLKARDRCTVKSKHRTNNALINSKTGLSADFYWCTRTFPRTSVLRGLTKKIRKIKRITFVFLYIIHF